MTVSAGWGGAEGLGSRGGRQGVRWGEEGWGGVEGMGRDDDVRTYTTGPYVIVNTINTSLAIHSIVCYYITFFIL